MSIEWELLYSLTCKRNQYPSFLRPERPRSQSAFAKLFECDPKAIECATKYGINMLNSFEWLITGIKNCRRSSRSSNAATREQSFQIVRYSGKL